MPELSLRNILLESPIYEIYISQQSHQSTTFCPATYDSNQRRCTMFRIHRPVVSFSI